MELIKLTNDGAVITEETARTLAEIEKLSKQLKEREELIKTAIKDEMEKRGIIKLENDNIVITYIASTDREQFNGKRLREEKPDVYDEYVEIKPVKSSIRVKVK